MKVLGEKISEGDRFNDAYCVSNGIRPLLSYGVKDSKTGRKTFLYVEALRRFVNEMTKVDLTAIQRRARQSHGGRMEHTFAVLKEVTEDPMDMEVSGSNNEPVGGKRGGHWKDSRGGKQQRRN